MVAGAAALLGQAGVRDPLAVKALLINSSNNVGWAADRGWGYLNLDFASRMQRFVVRQSLPPARRRVFRGRVNGNLYATLVWNRHIAAGRNGLTPVFHDLDLAIYDGSGRTQLGVSESAEQNVEQVAVQAQGDVLVVVTSYSESYEGGLEQEPFALALSRDGFSTAGTIALGMGSQESARVDQWEELSGAALKAVERQIQTSPVIRP